MSGVAVPKAKTEYWDPDVGLEAHADRPRPLNRVEQEPESELRPTFEVLADELVEDALGLSSTRRAVELPAFKEILAMGEDAIPLIMERIDRGEARPVWMRLLSRMTAFEPAAGADTIEESARRWIQWSKRRAVGH